MTSMPMMAVSLVVTPLVCLVSNSWVILWVALEINTLSFCTIAVSCGNKHTKSNKEAAMKYFIIQSVASAILVMYLSMQKESTISSILFFSGTAALLVKLAAVPFHSWFLEVMKKSSFKSSLLLMTWQKMAPIYLIMFMMKPLISISMILSAVVGSMMQMTTKTFMEIMALSSIFNLSWMLMSSMVSSKTLLTFTLIYWMSVCMMMSLMSKTNMKETSKDISMNTNPWTMMMMMATLAGLPPSIGFLAKWATVTQALKVSMATTVTVMLMVSTVNFYIYLRTVLTSMTSQFSMKQKQQQKKTNWETILAMMSNLPLLPMMAI